MLPHVFDCINNSEWAVRKMACDVLYTSVSTLKEVMMPFRLEVYDVVQVCKSDKFKPVRESALEVINALK